MKGTHHRQMRQVAKQLLTGNRCSLASFSSAAGLLWLPGADGVGSPGFHLPEDGNHHHCPAHWGTRLRGQGHIHCAPPLPIPVNTLQLGPAYHSTQTEVLWDNTGDYGFLPALPEILLNRAKQLLKLNQ